MSGVWFFDKGVVRLVENPGGEPSGGSGGQSNKVLVHLPSGEVITNYELLERKLAEVGWERYRSDNQHFLQFHKQSSVHLISVPRDFSKFKSVHMFDIVVKNRNVFEVRDA